MTVIRKAVGSFIWTSGERRYKESVLIVGGQCRPVHSRQCGSGTIVLLASLRAKLGVRASPSPKRRKGILGLPLSTCLKAQLRKYGYIEVWVCRGLDDRWLSNGVN
jgi:hypothetical protein